MQKRGPLDEELYEGTKDLKGGWLLSPGGIAYLLTKSKLRKERSNMYNRGKPPTSIKKLLGWSFIFLIGVYVIRIFLVLIGALLQVYF